MRQLKYSKQIDVLHINKVLDRLQLPKVAKTFKLRDILFLLLPFGSFILWFLSLRSVDLRSMNDLGLVSVLPATTIIALVIMMVSFCLALQQSPLRPSILFLHTVLLVFMLYGVTTLVESAPRFVDVYKHAGFIEYIMRNGTFDPNIYVYSSWQVFFTLSAFVTQIAGYSSALSYVDWSPVFFNLIYLGPLYIIFTSATSDKRLVWLGLWFYVLTKWVDQDHFSPQAFDYFLYLVVIAILLKWFKVLPETQIHMRKQLRQLLNRFPFPTQRFTEWLTAPDTLSTPTQPKQGLALLVVLIVIFALVVSSHPLTPFFIIASVSVLVIFRRCKPFWLPILMIFMTAGWIIFMARPFLVEHSNLLTSSLGHADISSNLTNRLAQGDQQHKFIASMRTIMSACVLGLAFMGGIRRFFNGYGDITFVLLAIAPFPLFVTQSYTGEMLIRIYFFSLPFLAFFAAAFFCARPAAVPTRWMTAALLGISIMLLSIFLFARNGTEHLEYKTNDEINGMRYLYSVAPPQSLFLETWDGIAWEFQDEEKYSSYSVTAAVPGAVETQNVDAIVHFIENTRYPKTYFIFTRSQKAMADSEGMPPDMLDRLQKVVLTSKKFKMVYSNPDVQIFVFVQ